MLQVLSLMMRLIYQLKSFVPSLIILESLKSLSSNLTALTIGIFYQKKYNIPNTLAYFLKFIGAIHPTAQGRGFSCENLIK